MDESRKNTGSVDVFYNEPDIARDPRNTQRPAYHGAEYRIILDTDSRQSFGIVQN